MNYIQTNHSFKIVSAGFQAQIEIRKSAGYSETAAAIAVGMEKKCLIVLGNPELECGLTDRFKNYIVRADEMTELFAGLR